MNITLYKNTSGNLVVNKVLTEPKEYPIILKEPCQLETPSIIISGIEDIGDVANYNYMYLGKFQRYYYITSKMALPGKRVELKGEVDVLYSFINDIKASTQLVSRQQSDKNLLIVDHQLIADNKNWYEMKNVGIALQPNSDKYYLQISGGA